MRKNHFLKRCTVQEIPRISWNRVRYETTVSDLPLDIKLKLEVNIK